MLVPAGYVYRDKLVAAREEFSLPGCCLKWYDIWPADVTIAAKQREDARSFLKEEIESRRLLIESDLGFVLLHHCGQVILLLVVTWRNTNEMWESVYVKDLQTNGSYRRMEYPSDHRGTYCVWELEPIWHERHARVRFLKSARDEQAKRTYVSDRYRGEL
jgi:hypothetical protein